MAERVTTSWGTHTLVDAGEGWVYSGGHATSGCSCAAGMVLQGSAVACVLISLHASQAAHAVPLIDLPPASLRRPAEALLAAALRNPRNLKFLIMSESDLPLYSPEVLYRQV